MHGFSLEPTVLINAEIDSMGGVVDGGVGIGTKASPCPAAIERAQAELRLEYAVREEKRRELEFLEKGGDPLDFKFEHAASVSVQSTSHTDQHPDQFLTSEAKGSFASTASPHGDSVESSGRLGVTTCEPNSADNFDGENELIESERKSVHPGKDSITPSEHSSQLDRSQNVKESEDYPIFHPIKGQAYRRRNRSRTNRDGPRLSSTDMASRGGHSSSLPGRNGMFSKPAVFGNQFEMDADAIRARHSSTISRAGEFPKGKLDISTSADKPGEQQNRSIKADEEPVATSTVEPDLVVERGNILPAEKAGESASATQLNKSSEMNGDDRCAPHEGRITNAVVTTKGLDSESSCNETSLSINVNGNINSDLFSNLKNVDNGDLLGEKSVSKDDKMLNEKHVTNTMESGFCIKEDQNSFSHHSNGFADKDQKEIDRGKSSPRNEAEGPSNIGSQEANYHTESKPEMDPGPLDDCVPETESSCPVRPPPYVDPSCHELNTNLSTPPLVSQPQTSNTYQLKLVDKASEDRLLEEARIIEAKRKRIAELSVGLLRRKQRRKSHWDFVIEEMAWLANDFAQERLWKMTAAAQISHQLAFASRLRLEEQMKCCKQKSVARTLAKAVMEFWDSAGLLVENVNRSESEKCMHGASSRAHEAGVVEGRGGGLDKDKASEQELQSCGAKQDPTVLGYAVRFLQYNCSSTSLLNAELSEIDLPEISWQDQFTEENLFYAVPPGAMETYRKSIESCLAESERTGYNIHEEVDASMYDAEAEIGYQENDYEEDEGENAYHLLGAFGSGKPSKKKRKNMKSYAARSYELGGDIAHGNCLENRNGKAYPALMEKRPANSLHVGLIPTKRMRTASRQRIVGPFCAGPAGVVAAPSRVDASSGDTSSFQDDQSTLHGGFVAPRGSEVDSAMDFEKQSTFDSTENFAKPKKKKKNKHQVAVNDQRWQLDFGMKNERKDHVKKRLHGHQLESDGNNGLFIQHAKKLKIAKQLLDNSLDNTMPVSGSVASPVASQMSNMSNQSKIIKLIGGRDRVRKAKALKVPAGQPGSGNPWSLFEDQALVVLVHDMGPNWELVSDAINSILQFKCIFRKPQECRERHKNLMDRTSGDGADSAEDSGSSQAYPSTLPGIPKGSARQLFQRLQGPMEEDTIKSHFEKIILIGQHVHYRKKQNDNQDLKQIASIHGSHVLALSQVIPNNVNGVILTPLDLCDATVSNQDGLPLGYQGPHIGGLGLPSQGPIPPMQTSSVINSSLQGSNMGIGNNLASPSAQFNSSRDARYSVSRSASLAIDEQQRLQQYNHMLPGRNVQPSNLSSSGALSGSDRGMHMLPGGNGVGMMAGTNRSMPMPRPGLQGVTSSMPNSGSMLASNTGGMPSNMNMHSGTGPGQGNSMFRLRDALHMVRPGQSSEHQRQMTPEMQMPTAQSNNQGVSPYGGLRSGFSNQTASTPVQTYPGHHQPQLPMPQQHPHVLGNSHHPHLSGSNHSATPEQLAFLRLARERQIQQRLLQRQQQHQHRQHQQLPSSSALTHVQTPPQLPISSSLQNSSQLQSQAAASQPVPLSPLTPSSPIAHVSSQPPPQQKHHVPPQGLGRTAQNGGSGTLNQVGKQRQRQAQQYQQSSRQHPQHRQQSQPQGQASFSKGIGRGNVLMHQSLPMDPSNLNGLSANPGNQVAEKGDQADHLMQGQALYSGSVPMTLKQVKQVSSAVDSSNQGQIPAVPVASNQALSRTVIPSVNHQQLQG